MKGICLECYMKENSGVYAWLRFNSEKENCKICGKKKHLICAIDYDLVFDGVKTYEETLELLRISKENCGFKSE